LLEDGIVSKEVGIKREKRLTKEETLKIFESDNQVGEIPLPDPDNCYQSGNIYTKVGLFGRVSMSGRKISAPRSD